METAGRAGRPMAIRIAVVLLLTVGCLVWALWGLDPSKARAALSAFRWAGLIPMAVLYLLMLPIRAWRFQLLLEEPVSLRGLVSVTAVTFLAINVVPFRLGELVRPYLLTERYGVALGGATAAVVVERLFDVLGLLTLLLLATALVPLPEEGVVVGGADLLAVGRTTLASAFTVGLLGVLLLALLGDSMLEALRRVTERLAPALSRPLQRLGTPFVAGLRHTGAHPARGGGALLATVLIWGLTGLALWTVMVAFPGVPATLETVLLNFAGAAVAITLLPTPGFFGAYELGSAGTLKLLGVEPSAAGTFAVMMHLAIFAHTVLLGLAFLAAEGWSLAGVVRASRELREEG